MSLGRHIPVEPLGERRWAHVEQAVMAELDSAQPAAPERAELPPRRRKTSWLVGAGALAMVAAAVVALYPRTQDAPALQTVRATTHEQPSELAFGPATMTVGPRSSVVAVGNDPSGWVVTLERGSVRIGLPPQPERRPLFVEAAGARVRVLGTVFTVVRHGERVRVEVERGTVEVTRFGERHRLTAGQSWESAGDRPQAEAREATRSAAQSVPPADERADTATDAPTATTDAGSSEAGAAKRDRKPQASAREPAKPAHAELFSRASRLESSDPAQASRIYAELARGEGRWAEVALFARGRLDLERGRERSGRMMLRQYLERYPDGLNAQDARELLRKTD